jgi:DNA repair exonuclease SbcCD nuclease subunit
MTVLVTGDLHWAENPRDEYRHTFVKTLVHWVSKKYQPKAVLILGDLTEAKDHHGAELVNRVVGHLHALAKHTPVIVLQGNHDAVDPDNPFFGFVGRIEGLTWVNMPLGPENAPAAVSGALGRVLLLPHTANYRRDWAGLPFKGCGYVFCHQTFRGANIGPRQLDGIPLDFFPKRTRIVSGDIHVPQDVVLPKHDVMVRYVGAPYLIDFGDDYDPRVLLLGGPPSTIPSIPCPGPQKRLLEISANDVPTMTRLRTRTKTGDILKVRVNIDPADHAKWPTIQEQVRKWGADNGYVIYVVQPVIDRSAEPKISKQRKARAKTDEQLLDLYAKSRAIDERTLKTGMNLMQEA